MDEKIVRATIEYEFNYTCKHTPPGTTAWYKVTFANRQGIVVAEMNCPSKDIAEQICDSFTPDKEKHQKLMYKVNNIMDKVELGIETDEELQWIQGYLGNNPSYNDVFNTSKKRGDN